MGEVTDPIAARAYYASIKRDKQYETPLGWDKVHHLDISLASKLVLALSSLHDVHKDYPKGQFIDCVSTPGICRLYSYGYAYPVDEEDFKKIRNVDHANITKVSYDHTVSGTKPGSNGAVIVEFLKQQDQIHMRSIAKPIPHSFVGRTKLTNDPYRIEKKHSKFTRTKKSTNKGLLTRFINYITGPAADPNEDDDDQLDSDEGDLVE